MITIRVGAGDEQQDFVIHEKVIRKASEFVDTTMKGPWLESQERVISLPEVTPGTFNVYMRWLMTSKLHSKVESAEAAKYYPHEDHYTEQTYKFWALWKELVYLRHLSHLGHYLLDTDFTDTVSDAVLQCTAELQSHRSRFPLSYGSNFYKEIPDGSPTRKLVAELIAWTAKAKKFNARLTESSKIHPDLMMDLLRAMASRYLSSEPSTSPLEGWETSCKYHCHGENKPCYREKASRCVSCSSLDSS